jgi:hypothetical protein
VVKEMGLEHVQRINGGIPTIKTPYGVTRESRGCRDCHGRRDCWIKKLPVSWGDGKLVLDEKETDEDGEDNSVKYFVTSKIDSPTEHVIRSYAKR